MKLQNICCIIIVNYLNHKILKGIVMYIKGLIIVCLVFILSSCMKTNQFDERSLMQNKVNAFQFLSDYHHQLHIMIGEEEGDGKGAYKEFLDALMSTNNYELIPIKNAALRIGNYNTVSESVKRLDYLVDYYQSGLSMEIEGILRGYGYMKNFSPDSLIELYDTIIAEESKN